MNDSYWERHWIYRPDALVIGGGFVGLSVAAALLERHPSLNVLVVDASSLPFGASTRNAGFACFGSLSELAADEQRLGLDETVALFEARHRGLAISRQRLGDKAMDFERGGGCEILPQNHSSLSRLKALNKALDSIEPDYFSLADDVSSLRQFNLNKRDTIVMNRGEGRLNPVLFLKNLSAYVQRLGGIVAGGLQVESISDHSTGVTLLAKDAQRGMIEFQCAQVVHATNAFAGALVPVLDVVPGRGQVLVTAPLAELCPFPNIHFDEGYYYLRCHGQRLVFGGGRNLDFEGERTTELQLNTAIQESLEKRLRAFCKLPFEVEQRWAGIMAFGESKMPIVQRLSDHQIAAVRMGGMGVALSGWVGEKVSLMW